MVRLLTPVEIPSSGVDVSLRHKVLVLGSCFADNIGTLMKDCGFDVLVNPFGTLYNPVSVLQAIERLSSASPFTQDECVEMGAGAGLVCSFSHHTAAARQSVGQFLSDANEALASASSFWKQCDRVLITFGTSWIWRHKASGRVVANCLKRPASEFSRELLTLDEAEDAISSILRVCGEKKCILTISPVRHLGEKGAHANLLSKSTLTLAIDKAAEAFGAEYFPSYEVMMDELRDYRFYAEDMVHPSPLAVRIIWERFCEFAVPSSDREKMREAEKASRRARHRGVLDIPKP